MQSKSTHTPGPWTLEREVWVNKLGMGDDHACQEIHHNGTTLGYWVDCEWSGWSPNARLIAAAPDLLEACKELRHCMVTVVGLIDEGDYDGADSMLNDLIDRVAAAAIARAEGGAA